MASNIKVGDKVRINEKYRRIIGGIQQNEVGTEFFVTDVKRGIKPVGHESDQIINGDPNGWGVWGDFLDIVQPSESWSKQDRIAKIQKTSASILEMGKLVDSLRRRDRITAVAHASLIHLLDDITDAIQEERA